MLTKVMGGAIAIMLLSMFFMWRANAALNKEVGAARVSIEQAALTNANNVETIDGLAIRINRCVLDQQADVEAHDRTVAQLKADFEALRIQKERTRVITEEIFLEPSCADLGRISITGSCPALANILFDHANSLD